MLIEILKYTLNFFELLSCVVGFLYWRKIKDTYWKWFPVYLGVIFLTEITAKYITHYVTTIPQLNSKLYRYFGIPVQFLFYSWLFYRYFQSLKLQKWALWGGCIYFISWLTEIFYLNDGKYWFQSVSYTVGSSVLLVLSILFFLKLVNSEGILQYKSNMMFWVSLGVLVFFVGTLPFYGLRNTLYAYQQVFYPYYYLSFILDFAMYIFFSIAFIWGRPK